jgi:hypothetical protein
MRGTRGRSVTAGVVTLAAIALLASGCSSSAKPSASASVEASSLGPAPAATAPAGECIDNATFDAATFPAQPSITNVLLPLIPGTKSVFSGSVIDEDDGSVHSHQIISIVSGVTKELDGVRSVVVWERDVQDDQLQESELAFEAQDNVGTEWNIGEYPEEYDDNGRLTDAPDSWIAGVGDARPGVNMPAAPKVSDQPYRQGLALGVKFHDCARTTGANERLCLPKHCYDGVLVSDEWSPLAPADGHQTKYYAPHVGTIRVAPVGGDSRETLDLTAQSTLSASELAAVNADVLKQDQRGYTVNPKVYAGTPPATAG